MKADITFILLPLTISTCVTCEEITVRGYEGGNAVIYCPSGELLYPKYLMRDGVEIIKSNRRSEWTHNGRVSLQDRDSSIFCVTIRQLTLEDSGTYWCGVNTWGLDYYYTKVNLEVVTGYHTPASVLFIPKVSTRLLTTTNSLSVTTLVASSKQHDQTERKTKPNESSHIPTDPTSAAKGLVYIGVGLAILVLVLVLIICTLYTQKSRDRKSSAPPAGREANTNSGSTQQCDLAIASTPPNSDFSTIYFNVPPTSNQNRDSVDYSPICFDQDEESLQYSCVGFTDPTAGGDKQGSLQRHVEDDTVIYSTIHHKI